jgi:hypothetical protein
MSSITATNVALGRPAAVEDDGFTVVKSRAQKRAEKKLQP